MEILPKAHKASTEIVLIARTVTVMAPNESIQLTKKTLKERLKKTS